MKEELTVRKAEMSELSSIMEIYRSAQDFMIASGNPHQWGHFNPSESMIKEDIEKGVCHVITEGGELYGVFALFDTPDPTYSKIIGGRWLNEEPYLTVHRIASAGKKKGIFHCAVSYCKALSASIRIDTHEENLVMQRHIEREGFIKCGTIFLANGDPRIAYQWIRE